MFCTVSQWMLKTLSGTMSPQQTGCWKLFRSRTRVVREQKPRSRLPVGRHLTWPADNRNLFLSLIEKRKSPGRLPRQIRVLECVGGRKGFPKPKFENGKKGSNSEEDCFCKLKRTEGCQDDRWTRDWKVEQESKSLGSRRKHWCECVIIHQHVIIREQYVKDTRHNHTRAERLFKEKKKTTTHTL